MILHKKQIANQKLPRYLACPEAQVIDIETTNLKSIKGDIFSYCIGFPNGDVEVCRFDNKPLRTRNKLEQNLQDFLTNTKLAKIAHNYKFEYDWLTYHGYDVPSSTIWHDTMLMSQLLRNLTPRHGLDYLCMVLCDYDTTVDKEVERQAHARGDRYDKVDEELFYTYQVNDGIRPMLLYRVWEPLFRKDERLYCDYINEIEMVKVTLRIQSLGIKVDFEESNRLIRWLTDELEDTREEARNQLGEYVNLQSSKQMIDILYNRFKLPVLRISKKSGAASTKKDVIIELSQKYDHPILTLMLKHRAYSHALSMIQSYVEAADERGILRPTINSNEGKTGRQTSQDPNMQNVQKDRRTDDNTLDVKNPFPVPARRCFRTRKNARLYFGDYKGIEMMLIIEVAQCLRMIENIKQGLHPHIVACKIFYGPHVPEAQRFIDKKKSKSLYDTGKNGHFCLAYGGKLAKFASTLGLRIKESRISMEQYQEEYPEIAYLVDTVKKRVLTDGYVTTPFGRKLYIPKDKIHAGLNYLIQGTAAGILKRGQVAADNYLKTTWDDRVRMVLPIHDELIFHVPDDLDDCRDEILTGISNCMTWMPDIKTPLEVEWKVSDNTWQDAKDYEIPICK
jgi:DNA polymerase-1